MTNEVAPTVLCEDGGFSMHAWKNVVVYAWGRQATVELVNKSWEAGEAFLKTHPEGCSSIHLTFANVPLADAAGRDRIQKLSEAFADRVAAIVFVIPGTGFWASALRSFITSVLWFERRRFKVLICGSVEEAAAWLPAAHVAKTGVVLEGAEVASALRAITKGTSQKLLQEKATGR